MENADKIELKDENSVNKIIDIINNMSDNKNLEKLYYQLFAKDGVFSLAMKQLSQLDITAKKEHGKFINEAKATLQTLITSKQSSLEVEAINNKVLNEKIDLSLPVQTTGNGGIHPISFVIEQIVAIFGELGFKVMLGDEISDDWHNFTALNIPLHHPSRQDHDTFYINMLDEDKLRKVLRTHTSTVQIKAMTNNQGFPLKIIAPGRTYRSDSDATHSPMFHQVEGLYVDKKENISVPLLKAVLLNFCSKFFGVKDVPLRLRSSYFPFTSPSFEVDIACNKSKAQLTIGNGDDWLEILGSGIIHKNVLENCGIDSNIYSGFAFGMGIERVTMLKYGFKDLRTLFEGDVRWLAHNNFNAIKTPTIFGGLN